MSYVIITGASAGIGEEFARELAKEKQDLILVARRKEKLETLASELEQSFGITTQVIPADLSATDGADELTTIVNEHDWPIHGLINNAGFGDRGAFTELSLERQLNMIQVNVTSLVSLTWQLLPRLSQARGSFVINVASTAAFQAGPNMAIYYASKAFVLSFSEALHEELREAGVSVSALCPGPTDSEFAQEANMTDTALFKSGTMSAAAVVRRSLAKRRRAVVVPGLRNLIMILATKISPRMINRKIAGLLQS